MLLIFQVCFFTGIALIILSFVLGNVFDVLGIDGLDLDIDFLGNSIFLPVSPIVFVLFSTVFGGTGWILTDYKPKLSVIFDILIAVGVGLIICSSVQHFIIKPLKKAQNTSTPSAEELVGIRVMVSETIVNDGFGEIRYVVNGNSYISPAKSTNGKEIKAGKEAAICWIEDYVFYVAGFDDIQTF